MSVAGGTCVFLRCFVRPSPSPPPPSVLSYLSSVLLSCPLFILFPLSVLYLFLFLPSLPPVLSYLPSVLPSRPSFTPVRFFPLSALSCHSLLHHPAFPTSFLFFRHVPQSFPSVSSLFPAPTSSSSRPSPLSFLLPFLMIEGAP